MRWWRLAAEQGLIGAQHTLGFMYQYGRGVPQDMAEAVLWYRVAAVLVDALAQSADGYLYFTGLSVPR